MKVLSYKYKDIEKKLNRDEFLLDIETTGLSREYARIYIIGVTYYDFFNEEYISIQYFGENPEEEEILLKKFVEDFKNFKRVITFNGDSFDLPFLKFRGNVYGIELPKFETLDIYRYIRREKNVLELKNYKLKTLEEYLGIFREDKISGKEAIELYYSYVENGIGLKEILLHNEEDLINMVRVLEIFNVVREKKTIYLGSTYEIKNYTAGEILRVDGITSNSLSIDNWNMDYTFRQNKNEFNLEVVLQEGIYPDGKSIYYLESSEKENTSELKTPKGLVPLSHGKEIYFKNVYKVAKYYIEKSLEEI